MLGIEPCLLIMFRWLGKFSRPQTTSQKVALLATASGFVTLTLPHSKTPVSMRVSYMTPGETDYQMQDELKLSNMSVLHF